MNRCLLPALFLFLITMLSPTQAESVYRIAVAPLQDLTASSNGLDMAMTTKLSSILQAHGLDIADMEKVKDFYIRNAIRKAGSLDSLTARKLCASLHCDGVLLGTVTERSERGNHKLAIVFKLLDGQSGEINWGTTLAFHIDDIQPLLGIGRLHSQEELQDYTLHQFADTFNAQSNRLRQREQVFPDYRICDVSVKPELVRDGTPVLCRIRIKFLNQQPQYLTVESQTGHTILQKSRIPDCYEGVISTDDNDGLYPLALTIHWSAQRSDKVENLSHYHVSNTPPQLKMHVSNGLSIGNLYAFSDQIILYPEIEDQRPIARWQVIIKNHDGKAILSEEQNAALPDRMEWAGKNSQSQQVAPGQYTMAMQIWDMAGNTTTVEENLYLQPSTQEMIRLTQVSIDGKKYLKLLPAESQVVPVERWSLVVETKQGTPLLQKNGWELPALIQLPFDRVRESVTCNLYALDKLGNSSSFKTAEVDLFSSPDKVASRINQDRAWSNDF